MTYCILDLHIEPTSLEAPALEIKGNLSTEDTLNLDITFGGYLNDTSLRLEKFISKDAQVKVIENTVKLTTQNSNVSFEALLITPHHKTEKIKDSGRDFVLPLIGSYYPFQANHIELVIEAKDARVVATLVLPSDQIAITKSITPDYGHFGWKEQLTRKEHLVPHYTFQSDSGKLEFEMVYRFRPFIALKLSTLPIIIMYAAALAAAGIPKLSVVPTSIQTGLIPVPMTGTPELALLGLLSILILLMRLVSTIPTGMTTRSWMLVLKGIVATFLSLLILDAFRLIGFTPLREQVFFERAFDFFLKFGTSWTITAIVISLFVYPFIVSKSKRNALVSILILLSIVLSITLFRFFPVHPVASILGT